MAGRPKQTTTGTRSPLLMALLGGLGSKKTDLSGIKLQDAITPGTLNDAGTLQGVNYTKKAVPTGIFGGFFNRDKAENLNNQITLNDILASQDTRQAAEAANKLNPIETEALRNRGNNQLLNQLKFIANPSNLKEYDTSSNIPNLNNILSTLNTGTDVNEAQDLAAQRANEIAANTQGANIPTAINNANLNKITSGLQLTNAPSAFTTQQKKNELGNQLLQSEITSKLNPIVPVGGERINLNTGAKIAGPVKVDPLIERMKAFGIELNGLSGTPSSAPTINTNNVSALPIPLTNPNTPTSSPVEGSIVVKDGKPGKIMNGVWTAL